MSPLKAPSWTQTLGQTHTEKLWVKFPPETSAKEYYYFYNMYISGLLGVEGNAWYINFAMSPPKKGKNFFQATILACVLFGQLKRHRLESPKSGSIGQALPY